MQLVTTTKSTLVPDGNIGRTAPKSLYRMDIVTFEDDRGAYDQRDAGGFIRLNALRLRTSAMATRGR